MIIIYIVIALLVGSIIGFFVKDMMHKSMLSKVKSEAEKTLKDAGNRAKDIIRKADLDSKEMLYKLRMNFDKQTSRTREELVNLERRLSGREENLERRLDFIEAKEKETHKKEVAIDSLEKEISQKEKLLEQLIQDEKAKLQKISGLSPEDARQLLLRRFAEDLKAEKAVMLRRMTEEIKEESDKKAQEIISLAIQKCAVEHTMETTVSVVQLPNDEIKGRIIGREGRNIRAFEMVTGVDLVIDDTPGTVNISSFDPIRREVARISLERLVIDGRIHPARIEEMVEKVSKDFEKQLVEEGKTVAFDVGMHDFHPELIKLLGKLKYRTSYGQNALQHSKEVAFIMGTLAGELGLNARTAKRCGLLHDIGKALDYQVEGRSEEHTSELQSH